MRVRAIAAVLVILLLAGCAAPAADAPEEDGTPEGPAPDDAAGSEDDGAEDDAVPTTPEDAPVVSERFLFTEDHGLAVLDPAEEPPAEAHVPESLAPTAFYSSFVQGVELTSWLSEPIDVPAEGTTAIPVTLSFVADEHAVSTMKPADFPPAGGWIGAEDRFLAFFGATDAPDTLEPGRVYTLTFDVPVPDGGFFIRAGERLAVYTWLAYETTSGGSASYVVGGEAGSGFDFTHRHFGLDTPTATVLEEAAGDFEPNPAMTTVGDASSARVPVDVPEDAAFVVFELQATGTGGARLDADLHVEGAGTALGAGTGPRANEVVVLGPHALSQARSLEARVQSASFAGGSWTLTVTAYGP